MHINWIHHSKSESDLFCVSEIFKTFFYFKITFCHLWLCVLDSKRLFSIRNLHSNASDKAFWSRIDLKQWKNANLTICLNYLWITFTRYCDRGSLFLIFPFPSIRTQRVGIKTNISIVKSTVVSKLPVDNL